MDPQMYFVAGLAIVAFIFVTTRLWGRNRWKKPTKPFPADWRLVLTKDVVFYNSLDDLEKERFERHVHAFLLNHRITGISTTIDDTDRVLVAASAVIPIFGFDEWQYTNLSEVLLYPGSFNQQFETAGDKRSILGMVGTGYMEGKMILSKSALHHGFANASDKRNTAIHEFVHLIDKSDGVIDGIPKRLLEQQYTIPWLDLIRQKTEEIRAQESDINPYGATGDEEFFAVASEYFFERPKLLRQKHPQLYQLLERAFNQKMSGRTLKKTRKRIGRNSPCPCGSGEKFKHCCGRSHY